MILAAPRPEVGFFTMELADGGDFITHVCGSPRRRWGTKGKLATPWNVMVNVPAEVLAADGERVPVSACVSAPPPQRFPTRSR